MDPGITGNLRCNCARLQRRRNDPLLLRRRPAPPPLNRRDHLDLSIRHVSIPMNTHMTHPYSPIARRPSPDAYLVAAIGFENFDRPPRWIRKLRARPQTHSGAIALGKFPN